MKSCGGGLDDNGVPEGSAEVTREVVNTIAKGNSREWEATRDVEYESDEIGYDPRGMAGEAGNASGALTGIGRSAD